MAIGRGEVVLSALFLLVVLMFLCAVTVRITKSRDEPKVALPGARRLLLLAQVAVLVFVVGITFYTSLMFHGVVERHPIPIWSAAIGAFSRLGERVFTNNIVLNPTLAMANPARYVLLPLPFLLLLGARFRELGFCRGHRSLSVAALWCSIPSGVFICLLALGRLSCIGLVRRLLSHLPINGFGEEFLIRGALQTRLRALFGTSWAITIQAVTFGIWHFAANFGLLGMTGIVAVTAYCVVKSATFGLAYGIIFQRTRNLLACSTIHAVTNSLAG